MAASISSAAARALAPSPRMHVVAPHHSAERGPFRTCSRPAGGVGARRRAVPLAATGKSPADKVVEKVAGAARPLVDAAKAPGAARPLVDAAKAPAGKKKLVQRVTDPLADRTYRPPMDGDAPDFWEGQQFNALGFFLQYLWAFGLAFALIACAYAVRTYNSGASDFKGTDAFKEAVTATQGPAQSTPSQTPAPPAVDDAPPL